MKTLIVTIISILCLNLGGCTILSILTNNEATENSDIKISYADEK